MTQSHKKLKDVTKDLRNLQAAIVNYTSELMNGGQMLKDRRESAGKIVEQEFLVTVGATIGWHHTDIVMPFDVDLICGAYDAPDAESGDKLICRVLPPVTSGVAGLVGLLDAPVTIGANSIEVPAAVASYFDEGAYYITLFNTTNADTSSRLVTKVDGTTIHIGKVNLNGGGSADAMDKAYPAVSTAIILERHFAEHCFLGPRSDEMGEDAWGSSSVPSGYVMRASYYNTSTTEKKYRFILDYFCGTKEM